MGVRQRLYHSPEDLPGECRVFPLTGGLLLPGGELPLNVFEPRYLGLVDDALAGNRLIGMIQPRIAGNESTDPAPELARVGCLGRITAFAEMGDGRYEVTLSGVCRFAAVAEMAADTPYRWVRPDYGDYAEDLSGGDAEGAVRAVGREPLFEILSRYLEERGFDADWSGLRHASGEWLLATLPMMLPLPAQEKQALLVAETLHQRAQLLMTILEMAVSGNGESDSTLQ